MYPYTYIDRGSLTAKSKLSKKIILHARTYSSLYLTLVFEYISYINVFFLSFFGQIFRDLVDIISHRQCLKYYEFTQFYLETHGSVRRIHPI